MAATTVGALTATTLVHTCTISARQQARDDADAPAYDPYGEAVPTTYAAAASGVPCFARQRAGAGDVEEPGRSLVGQSWQVRLARGTAIGADDTIADVRDSAGVSIVDGPLTVTDLHHRAGHILALCQAAALAGPTTTEEVTP